ncbi:uncharacterized protein [Prorops nasuta]|uniref:uncharacterized protein n=1 Tax=Prorops nasuta TaxID=863751 RepID=UPI0034CEC651
MDPRSTKARNFVAVCRDFTDSVLKEKIVQMKWFSRYERLLEENEMLRGELKKLYEEQETVLSEGISKVEDKRSCLPAPTKTSQEVGWLASKPEFLLEKYGPFIIRYPNPVDEVPHIGGRLPRLAAGKGLVA